MKNKNPDNTVSRNSNQNLLYNFTKIFKMKKTLLVLFAIVFCKLYSQNIDNYGLKAGLNFSTLATDLSQQYTTIDTSNKVGIYFGVYAEKKYSDKGSLVGEALISLQGAKLNQKVTISYPIPGYPTQSQSSSMDVSITQLNIPIYYKYSTSEIFFIYGGGYLGLILGSKVQSVKFDNNTIDLGLIAGASYKVNEKLNAEARYNFGILKLDDIYNFQNRVFNIGISYQLK